MMNVGQLAFSEWLGTPGWGRKSVGSSPSLQCSTILPPETWNMSMALPSTRLPMGASSWNSPKWMPRIVTRAATRSFPLSKRQLGVGRTPAIRCTWRRPITSQMVDRVEEKPIGERAAALADEVRSPSFLARRLLAVERSRRERRNAASGSCCSRRIGHGANRCTTERLPMRWSERSYVSRQVCKSPRAVPSAPLLLVGHQSRLLEHHRLLPLQLGQRSGAEVALGDLPLVVLL